MKFIKQTISMLFKIRLIALLPTAVFALPCRGQVPSEYDPIMHKQFVYNSISSLALDVTYTEDYNSLRPVLVYIHGGGWWQDDKSEWSRAKSAYFLDNGIVSVSVDYTLAPDPSAKILTDNGVYPKSVADVVHSIEWVRKNISKFGGDSTNIFLMGYSAGVSLVDLAVLQNRLLNMKDYIRGVINLDAGAYLVMNRLLMKSVGIDSVWMNAFGTSNFKNENLDPVHLIFKNQWLPPFLLICSTAIERKSPCISFNNTMLKNNHISQVLIIENTNHQDITRFVEDNLSFKQDLVNFVQNHTASYESSKPEPHNFCNSTHIQSGGNYRADIG